MMLSTLILPGHRVAAEVQFNMIEALTTPPCPITAVCNRINIVDKLALASPPRVWFPSSSVIEENVQKERDQVYLQLHLLNC